MTDNDSTGNSSLVDCLHFFRAISRTTSTFGVILQENVFESSLAEPENRIYHRWCTFPETNPADEKTDTVTGKHTLVYSNIARAKPKLKIQIVMDDVNIMEISISMVNMTPARQCVTHWLTVTVTLDSRTLPATGTALAHSLTHWHSLISKVKTIA